MKVLFLLTLFILFAISILIKKKNDKISIVISIIFIIDIFYFFNMLLVHILSYLKLGEDYLILTIINLLATSIILIYNYTKNRKITFQKYYISVKEILSILILFAVCFCIGFYRFGGYKEIAYETTDPTVHYKTSKIYSEKLVLLDDINAKDEMYVSLGRNMTGFYINCGFVMNIFDKVQDYKVYMFFDVGLLFLLASTFYITCLKVNKKEKNYLIILIMTGLYFTAYCLNSFIFGFGYLGAGILATNLLILTWLLIDEEHSRKIKKIYYLLLFLFNYGLFFSYYLFIPVLYLSQGLYIIYKFIKKKYKFKEALLIGIFTLIIPAIIGFCYFVLPGLISTGNTVLSSSYSMEGYIYRNLWSNFILIIPMVIYAIISRIKEKKFTVLSITMIIEILFILITFIAGLFFNKVSSYYYFKSYYIMWLFAYLYIANLISKKDANSKIIVRINIYYILIIILIVAFNIGEIIREKNYLFNTDSAASGVSNIYWFNGVKIISSEPVLNKNQVKTINEAQKYNEICVNRNKEFIVLGSTLQKLWYYSMTNNVPIHNHSKGALGGFYEEEKLDEILSSNDTKCIIVLNYDDYADSIDLKKFEIIYKNDNEMILKNKSVVVK